MSPELLYTTVALGFLCGYAASCRAVLCAVQGLEKMRASCKLAAQVLQHAGSLVKPGITTDEIDQVVHDMIVAAGAYPSPLNYGKFPKSVCTSVNEVVCHGIPDKRCASCQPVVVAARTHLPTRSFG